MSPSFQHSVFVLLSDLIPSHSHEQSRRGCGEWRTTVSPPRLCQAVGDLSLYPQPHTFILILLLSGKISLSTEDLCACDNISLGRAFEDALFAAPADQHFSQPAVPTLPPCTSAWVCRCLPVMFINKKLFTTALLGLLVTLSIIALVLSLYGMVFDAGSSHTSLFVYEWDSDKQNNTGVVSQTFSCDVQGPGITSYASDPPKAGDSLRECLEEALKVVPAAKQRDVSVYFGATAGMRLLREQNSSAADQILAEIAKTIQEYPVAFCGAQIITGEEEGAYGWITINYLLESFTKVGGEKHLFLSDSFGALDLGGASTQISFAPKGSFINWNETSRFMLYGYSYNIYTHSYICYGQNEMWKRLAKELIVVRGELGGGGRIRFYSYDTMHPLVNIGKI
uniref:Ectonucleoside triphosphate diphosphohydrolase 8 n=1 Tax=Phasianus colchicus TaxID=9054 RepID=A0A669Q4Z3_PHACC